MVVILDSLRSAEPTVSSFFSITLTIDTSFNVCFVCSCSSFVPYVVVPVISLAWALVETSPILLALAVVMVGVIVVVGVFVAVSSSMSVHGSTKNKVLGLALGVVLFELE